MHFGLIPEFVGRLPVLVNVDPLDRDALMRILVEPKNALVKQYQQLLALDNLELVFEDSALGTAADHRHETWHRWRADCARSSRADCST